MGLSRHHMKVTTHLHLVLWLRMSGAMPLLPHVPLWHPVGQLYLFYLYYFNMNVCVCVYIYIYIYIYRVFHDFRA